MNRFTPDIRRAGRSGHQYSVLAFSKRRVPVGAVDVLNDALRVEQNHDIVGKKPIVLTRSSFSQSKIEPVSATPKGERTTVTSISAASDELL
jgi:hypothetical protein